MGGGAPPPLQSLEKSGRLLPAFENSSERFLDSLLLAPLLLLPFQFSLYLESVASFLAYTTHALGRLDLSAALSEAISLFYITRALARKYARSEGISPSLCG
jgi:hypothetical protein